MTKPPRAARTRHGRSTSRSGFLSSVRRHLRGAAAATATLLVAVGLTVGVFLTPVVADEFISLSATAGNTIQDGEKVSISLSAHASSATGHYNVVFRYELPAGVSYASGSSAGTGPTSDPTIIIITDTPASGGVPAVTHQILVFSNVADLPAGVSLPLTFAVVPEQIIYPVGSTIQGAAAVYAQSDPRLIVKFDPTTGAASNFTASDTANVLATPLILGLALTGVGAGMLFIELTFALCLLILGIGMVWRARSRRGNDRLFTAGVAYAHAP